MKPMIGFELIFSESSDEDQGDDDWEIRSDDGMRGVTSSSSSSSLWCSIKAKREPQNIYDDQDDPVGKYVQMENKKERKMDFFDY